MDSEDNLPTKRPTTSPATTAPSSSPADKVRKVVALTKLRSHFYQPGQTEAQIRGVIDDMLVDLDGLTPGQVEEACAQYRRDGTNKFFPTPGQIIEALRGNVAPPVHRLPKYDPAEFECVRTGKLKPVGQILREHGYHRTAAQYEARSSSSEAAPQ